MKARTLLFLLALPAFAAAQDDDAATWHLALRGGMHIHESQAFDFISDDAWIGSSDLTLEYRVYGPLWVGASWRNGGTEDTVYSNITTQWSFSEVRASAQYRYYPLPPLATFARLGPVVNWTAVTLTSTDGELEAEDWTLGGYASVGIEFMPLHRYFFEEWENDVGVGLSAEFTYARYIPLDLQASTTDLGRFNPSGPGWLLGIAAQW